MDEITAKPKLNHNSTLVRFYHWVRAWRDRLPLSTDHKSGQAVSKKPEQQYHDRSQF